MNELLHAMSGLWAIKQDALEVLVSAATSMVGAAANPPLAAAQAAQPGREDGQGEPYRMAGQVAIIPVSGPLSKEGYSIFGYKLTSGYRDMAHALAVAVADPDVRAIMLDVDSPGGAVDGIDEMAQAVASAAAQKPLYAYADGLMASAAYWASVGAREIAAPVTANIGSIGVIMLHKEYSAALEQAGVKYNIIAAGHYKAAGNSIEPLSDEMRAYMQSGIDSVYELFLDAVATGRGVTKTQAKAMADGKIFLAGEALEAGLIDRICSKADFINHIQECLTMTLDDMKAQHPDAVQQLRAEMESAHAEAMSAAVGTAKSDEQERILAIAKTILPAADADKLAAIVASGVSPEMLATLQGVLAPAAQTAPAADPQAAALDALKAAAATNVALNPLADEQAAKPDFEALVAAHIASAGVSRAAAIREIAAKHPDAHKAYIESKNA